MAHIFNAVSGQTPDQLRHVPGVLPHLPPHVVPHVMQLQDLCQSVSDEQPKAGIFVSGRQGQGEPMERLLPSCQ